MGSQPLIVWGVDPPSRMLAENLKTRAPAAGRINITYAFSPSDQEDLMPQFLRLVQELKEAARSSDFLPLPEVCLIAASQALEDESVFELLSRLDRSLTEDVGGSATLTLVLVVPPPLAATPEHNRRSRAFLDRLEKMADRVPHLSLIFVNQLTSRLYGDSTLQGAEKDQVWEQLYRELLDEDLRRGIEKGARRREEQWPMLLNNRCCYSTLGFYRLEYPAREGLLHLRARFWYELLHEGLLCVSTITAEDRWMIQSRAVNFVQTRLSHARARLPAHVHVDPASPPESHTDMVQKLGRLLQEVNLAIERETPGVDKVLDGFEGIVYTEVAQFLCNSPGHLAGGSLYVDALRGSRISLPQEIARVPGTPSSARELSSVRETVEAFCRGDAVDALVKCFREYIVPELSKQCIPVAPRREEQTILDWLQTVVQAHTSYILNLPVGPRSAERFCIRYLEAVVLHLKRETIQVPHIRQLVDDVGEILKLEMGEIFKPFEDLTLERDSLVEELARFGWFERWFWRASEYQTKLARTQELEHSMRILADEFVRMCELYRAQIGENILPYYFRARAARRIQDEIAKAAGRLDEFVERMGGVIDGNWETHSVITQYSTPTKSTVLTPKRCHILYKGVTQGKSPLRFVDEVLSFTPREVRPSYVDCHNLGDHYLNGADTLLDRISDFSLVLFSPIERLDILNIIELEGKAAAIEILRTAVDRSRRFMDLSMDRVPESQRSARPLLYFHVKASQGEKSRLGCEFKPIFAPSVEFTDSRDPCAIDITCLTLGFPAFLIQGLPEPEES